MCDSVVLGLREHVMSVWNAHAFVFVLYSMWRLCLLCWCTSLNSVWHLPQELILLTRAFFYFSLLSQKKKHFHRVLWARLTIQAFIYFFPFAFCHMWTVEGNIYFYPFLSELPTPTDNESRVLITVTGGEWTVTYGCDKCRAAPHCLPNENNYTPEPPHLVLITHWGQGSSRT